MGNRQLPLGGVQNIVWQIDPVQHSLHLIE